MIFGSVRCLINALKLGQEVRYEGPKDDSVAPVNYYYYFEIEGSDHLSKS